MTASGSPTEVAQAGVKTHTGAGWIRKAYAPKSISPLGEQVANLLDDVFAGIYHLNLTSLGKVDWANPLYIEVVIGKALSTVDFNDLTMLVVLCHDRMLRMQIEAAAPRYLRLVFHARAVRHGRYYERCPTIEDAIITARLPRQT